MVNAFIPLIALFNPKIKLFVNGRKQIFAMLQENLTPSDQTIWMHCASLGEFEQGRPVLEKLKLLYPNYKLVLSFFSPSGYEIRKNYEYADVVVYLPLDTRKNAIRFIESIHPTLAIFVKYEFWPNILLELRQKNIKTILISGIFRKNQVFFKKNKKWFRNSLKTFCHFFVQNDDSVKLLDTIGFSNVTHSGDTRFDRVSDLIEQKIELPLLSKFVNEHHTLVAGSTWPKDELLLVEYINKYASDQERFIVAPHNINSADIDKLIQKINKKTLIFSKANTQNILDVQVLIIDSIGILTSVYSYANVAYVGGGFGAGIHNILEPATYGIPIIIAPNYQKFKEANDLILSHACFEINSQNSLNKQLQEFYNNKEHTKKAGAIALKYIHTNIGATQKIIQYVKSELS